MAHWTHQSNVADVLSLGPRTAGRLLRLGVHSVSQLLAAKPQAVAERLGDSRFNAETVADWQREARLLIEAPDLPTEAARLLAVAGFSSARRVARATPTELLAAVEQLADDPERASWVSQQPRPSVKEVNTWIRCAQQSLAVRAA
ncbi:MAG: DUF4332 domain-containing protein [Planctomycetes bacterium]|nr:DUF4332 domain-containing protein [Planctomycetota bacterium]